MVEACSEYESASEATQGFELVFVSEKLNKNVTEINR